MENSIRLPQKIIALGLLFFFFSCNRDGTKDSVLKTNVLKSFSVKMSNLKLNLIIDSKTTPGYRMPYASITVDNESPIPNEIGIEISADAFKNLVTDHAKILPLLYSTTVVRPHHKAKQLIPFDIIGLNLIPYGYPPRSAFDSLHFDILADITSAEEQRAIPNWSPQTDAFINRDPSPGYLPPDYLISPSLAHA